MSDLTASTDESDEIIKQAVFLEDQEQLNSNNAIK